MSWLHIIIEFLIGCGLLAWGADRFIIASASIAKRMKLSPLVIGMLLVGFGTSVPELVVSAIASWKGMPGLAIGNAIGSNIANVGLVIGIAALLAPISIHSRILKREFPILILVSLITGGLMLNHMLSRVDGVILLLLLVVHLYWVIFLASKRPGAPDLMAREFQKEMPAKMKTKKAVLWWFVGIILLLIASELMVSSATEIAKLLHLSDLVIGLTIVAIGTSLPELATTVISAMRHEDEIAIGNILGSNIFNLLAVLAMPALISPGKLPAHLLTRDYPWMMAFTFALWLIPFASRKKNQIGRFSGILLLLGFVAYLVFLVLGN